MSSPIVHAFFMGRALATAISEQVEQVVTETMSTLGRFDAEQRENLRNFTDDVMARAEAQVSEVGQGVATGVSSGSKGSNTQDLQATIDNLRAEIAQVRATLQQYRASLN
jgi:polyhydroxyalkanoate synthesis regulator phasin